MVTAAAILVPAGAALFAWWFGTGAVLYADNLPPRRFRAVMLGAAIVFAASLAGLHRSAANPSAAGDYLAFVSALGAWSWQEISFYTGWITGPRPEPCPRSARLPERFVRALGCSLYHELSAAITGAAVVMLTAGGVNKTGLATYAVLWAMHESARINVLIGVPNADESFLPAHMDFLRSYVTPGRINRVFTISVLSCIGVTVALACLGGGGPGRVLLATLAGIATAEHLVLALPVPTRALWAFSFRRPGPARLRFGAVETGLRPAEHTRL